MVRQAKTNGSSVEPDAVPVITQHDVARAAGVSQSVVSRVFRGSGYVSDDNREKVLKVSLSMGYVPNAGVRTLVKGSSNIVALIASNITNAFYPYLVDKLTSAMQQQGSEVMLFNASAGRSIDDMYALVLQYKVKAAVIARAKADSRIAKELTAAGIKSVMLDCFSSDMSCDTVTCDNFSAGKSVAEAFLGAGYRRVAFIGGDSTISASSERRKGFLAGLQTKAVKPILDCDGDFSYEWGYQAAALINAQSGLQAAFCADDEIAMGVCDRLRFEFHRKIPQELAVVGFDDVPTVGRPSYSLSTIRQPIDAMIEETIRLLGRPATHTAVHSRLPGALVRRSTF